MLYPLDSCCKEVHKSETFDLVIFFHFILEILPGKELFKKIHYYLIASWINKFLNLKENAASASLEL